MTVDDEDTVENFMTAVLGIDLRESENFAVGYESVEGNRYVIGCFSDKDTGKKSVLISPTTPRDDVEITLNMSGKTKSVIAYIGGEKTTLEVKDNKLTLKIDRGDAVFIQL